MTRHIADAQRRDEADIPAWKRHGRAGPFDWYLQCSEHKAPHNEFKHGCFSCLMVQDHNYKLYCQIAEEMGWLLDEPAGDVPMDILGGAL